MDFAGDENEEYEVEEVEEEVEEEAFEKEEDGAEDEGRGDVGTRDEGGENAVADVDGSGHDSKQGDGTGSLSSAGKIFVGGVAWETTEETFTAHFEKYGEITDSVIMRDKHSQMPRGFGFVTFANPSVIDKVLEDEHIIDGRTVEVKRTVPRKEMPSKSGLRTKKIFVGGIPTSLTEDELKDHFSSYGVVVEHQIMVDHSTGRSRGFGFVTFEKEDAVDKLVSEGRMHDLTGKQVEIKRAEPKRSGGDLGINGRANRGNASGSQRAYRENNYGYGGGYSRSGGEYPGYGGSAGYGFGRGYAAAYGGYPAYGAGYGPGYGGPMYGGSGFSGPGAYGSSSGGAYGGAGGYGSFYGSYGSGRGYGNRYHPYSQ